jgi:hypothetical protein
LPTKYDSGAYSCPLFGAGVPGGSGSTIVGSAAGPDWRLATSDRTGAPEPSTIRSRKGLRETVAVAPRELTTTRVPVIETAARLAAAGASSTMKVAMAGNSHRVPPLTARAQMFANGRSCGVIESPRG